MGYKFTMYPCNNQACIKEKHFKLLSPALAKSELNSSSAWCPGPLCHASLLLAGALHTPVQPHQLSPPLGTVPMGVLLQRGGWCSSCDPSLSLPYHHTGKVPHKAWAFLTLSFCPFIPWPPKRKGILKTGGERMETKVRWIFPGPSQIYSTLVTGLRRTGMSHIPSAPWAGFWFWLKITTT